MFKSLACFYDCRNEIEGVLKTTQRADCIFVWRSNYAVREKIPRVDVHFLRLSKLRWRSCKTRREPGSTMYARASELNIAGYFGRQQIPVWIQNEQVARLAVFFREGRSPAELLLKSPLDMQLWWHHHMSVVQIEAFREGSPGRIFGRFSDD